MHCLNIADKLEAGTYPTKPLETFFLSRHILTRDCFQMRIPTGSLAFMSGFCN